MDTYHLKGGLATSCYWQPSGKKAERRRLDSKFLSKKGGIIGITDKKLDY